MTSKNKHEYELAPDNLDKFLAISGYIFQRNDEELKQFELLYENYDFKLKNIRIDPKEIINRSFSKKGKILKIKNKEEQEDIDELKIAARKGNEQIPKSVLDKMRRKHTNGNQ